MAHYEIRNHFLFKDGKQVPYLPTPNRGGIMQRITGIVDHDTASNPLDPTGDIGWLRMHQAKASAHFVIDWYGNIFQLAPCNVSCWHAGPSRFGGRVNYNAHSIGIEHDNPGYLRKVDEGIYQGVCTIDTKRNPAFHVAPAPVQHNPALIMFWLAYSPSQIEASAGLHMALASAYPTIDEVRGHWEICPGRKTDTNPLFPLARMRSIVLGNRQNLPTGPERVAELAADPKAEIGVPATTIPAGYVADQAAQAALSSPQAAYSDLTAQLTTLSYQGVALAGKVVMVLGILFALYVAGKYAWQIAIGPMWRRLVPRQPDPAMLAGSDYQPVVTAYDGAYPPSPPVHRPRSLRPKRRKPSKRRRAA